MSSYEDTWDVVMKNPPEAYKTLFKKERGYLQKTVTPNSKVLDIACGDGRNINSLVSITQDITGLDNSERAVNDARRNLSEYPSVRIILGDAFNLPFEDNTFDFVILSMTLVNFDHHKKTAVEEMKRVVKKEGKIILSVYSEKALPERLSVYNAIGAKIKSEVDGFVTFDIDGLVSEQFSLEKLKVIADQAGLEIVDVEEVENLAYIFTLILK